LKIIHIVDELEEKYNAYPQQAIPAFYPIQPHYYNEFTNSISPLPMSYVGPGSMVVKWGRDDVDSIKKM